MNEPRYVAFKRRRRVTDLLESGNSLAEDLKMVEPSAQ
jgi:hypothetical protein